MDKAHMKGVPAHLIIVNPSIVPLDISVKMEKIFYARKGLTMIKQGKICANPFHWGEIFLVFLVVIMCYLIYFWEHVHTHGVRLEHIVHILRLSQRMLTYNTMDMVITIAIPL